MSIRRFRLSLTFFLIFLFFPSMISAISIKKYLSCKGGCIASVGPDQPAEVSYNAPKELNPGACLYSSAPSMLSCDGSHPLPRGFALVRNGIIYKCFQVITLFLPFFWNLLVIGRKKLHGE